MLLNLPEQEDQPGYSTQGSQAVDEQNRAALKLSDRLLKPKREIEPDSRVVMELAYCKSRLLQEVATDTFQWNRQNAKRRNRQSVSNILIEEKVQVAWNSVWNILWANRRVEEKILHTMLPYQKISQLPQVNLFMRKKEFHFGLHRVCIAARDDTTSNILRSWILPYDYIDLIKYISLEQESKVFIYKPIEKSNSKGVYLATKSQINCPLDRHVVQEYVMSPCLLNGFKFDIRVYVLIKRALPLSILLYREGIAQFSGSEWVPPSWQTLRRLTRYVTNKQRRDVFNANLKLLPPCSLTQLFAKLSKHYGVAAIDKLWEEVKLLTVLTVLSNAVEIQRAYRQQRSNECEFDMAFELISLDITIDHNLKPFLIDVDSVNSNLEILQECINGEDQQCELKVMQSLLIDTMNILDVKTASKIDYQKQLYGGAQTRYESQKRKQQLKSNPQQPFIDALTKTFNYENSHLGSFERVYPTRVKNQQQKYQEILKKLHKGVKLKEQDDAQDLNALIPEALMETAQREAYWAAKKMHARFTVARKVGNQARKSVSPIQDSTLGNFYITGQAPAEEQNQNQFVISEEQEPSSKELQQEIERLENLQAEINIQLKSQDQEQKSKRLKRGKVPSLENLQSLRLVINTPSSSQANRRRQRKTLFNPAEIVFEPASAKYYFSRKNSNSPLRDSQSREKNQQASSNSQQNSSNNIISEQQLWQKERKIQLLLNRTVFSTRARNQQIRAAENQDLQTIFSERIENSNTNRGNKFKKLDDSREIFTSRLPQLFLPIPDFIKKEIENARNEFKDYMD